MTVALIRQDPNATPVVTRLRLLKDDADVSRRLSVDQLEALFDLGYHLKHVDAIFIRVFGSVD